jgi:NitT/TauT family transport system permease protein
MTGCAESRRLDRSSPLKARSSPSRVRSLLPDRALKSWRPSPGIALFLGAWFLASYFKGGLSIPSPIATIAAAVRLLSTDSTWLDIRTTTFRVLCGFMAAAAVGLPLGIVCALSPRLSSWFSIVLEILRPIPPIAWIPVGIALFGLGNGPAFLLIFLGALFPIYSNARLGAESVPVHYLERAKLLGLTRAEMVRYVIWPGGALQTEAGITIGIGFACMCVIAAEMTGVRSGLGNSLQQLQGADRMDDVFAYMILVGLLGIALRKAAVLVWRRLHITQVGYRVGSFRSRSFASRRLPSPFDMSTDAVIGSHISIRNLSFSYWSHPPVFVDLFVDIPSGATITLFGRSGTGKTTLLRYLAGLPERDGPPSVSTGVLEIAPRGRISMMSQLPSLFPWFTVRDNAMFASLAVKPGDYAKTVDDVLLSVGIESLAETLPTKLSVGQQQKAALAVALLARPALLLLDEPLASVDAISREELQVVLAQSIDVAGATTVAVTHDPEEAVFLSDLILVLDGSPAHVVQSITIAEPQPRSADFRQTQLFAEAVRDLQNSLRRSPSVVPLPG